MFPSIILLKLLLTYLLILRILTSAPSAPSADRDSADDDIFSSPTNFYKLPLRHTNFNPRPPRAASKRPRNSSSESSYTSDSDSDSSSDYDSSTNYDSSSDYDDMSTGTRRSSPDRSRGRRDSYSEDPGYSSSDYDEGAYTVSESIHKDHRRYKIKRVRVDVTFILQDESDDTYLHKAGHMELDDLRIDMEKQVFQEACDNLLEEAKKKSKKRIRPSYKIKKVNAIVRLVKHQSKVAVFCNMGEISKADADSIKMILQVQQEGKVLFITDKLVRRDQYASLSRNGRLADFLCSEVLTKTPDRLRLIRSDIEAKTVTCVVDLNSQTQTQTQDTIYKQQMGDVNSVNLKDILLNQMQNRQGLSCCGSCTHGHGIAHNQQYTSPPVMPVMQPIYPHVQRPLPVLGMAPPRRMPVWPQRRMPMPPPPMHMRQMPPPPPQRGPPPPPIAYVKKQYAYGGYPLV